MSVNVTTNIPSRDYTHPDNHTSPTYDMTHGSKPFYKITTGLNFNFHLRPTFTQKALHSAVAVYEFRVTRNSFWTGFLWKSVSFRVILLKIVHKHAGIYSSIIKLSFPGIILWLCWPKAFFFSLLLCPICCCQRYLAVEDAVWLSRRRILSVFVSEDSYDSILFTSKFDWYAGCKQNGSRLCNKWMVLQNCFLFLPLCLSSYDWIQ